MRQSESFLPIPKANGPNLHCDSGKSLEQKVLHKLSHDLRNGDSLYWSNLLIPYGHRVFRRGSNSSLKLFWFDLSTPGYDLSNKARHG